MACWLTSTGRRAVQYFGNRHHGGAQRYDLLAPLLEITTALDPHLLVAYEYGTNFLAPEPPGGGGMPERAIQLEEFGIRNNPDEWRLYYNEGFIRYMDLKDYAGAAEVFARGARVPNAHPFLAILAGKMAEHVGDQQLARMMWSTTYQTTKDKNVRANAAAHLRALQVDEDVTTLEAVIGRYQQQTGRFPASFCRTGGRGTAAWPAPRPARPSLPAEVRRPCGTAHPRRLSLHPEGHAPGIRSATGTQVSTDGLRYGRERPRE